MACTIQYADGVQWCAGDCHDNDPNSYSGSIEGPAGDPTCVDTLDNDCDTLLDLNDSGCVN